MTAINASRVRTRARRTAPAGTPRGDRAIRRGRVPCHARMLTLLRMVTIALVLSLVPALMVAGGASAQQAQGPLDGDWKGYDSKGDETIRLSLSDDQRVVQGNGLVLRSSVSGLEPGGLRVTGSRRAANGSTELFVTIKPHRPGRPEIAGVIALDPVDGLGRHGANINFGGKRQPVVFVTENPRPPQPAPQPAPAEPPAVASLCTRMQDLTVQLNRSGVPGVRRVIRRIYDQAGIDGDGDLNRRSCAVALRDLQQLEREVAERRRPAPDPNARQSAECRRLDQLQDEVALALADLDAVGSRRPDDILRQNDLPVEGERGGAYTARGCAVANQGFEAYLDVLNRMRAGQRAEEERARQQAEQERQQAERERIERQRVERERAERERIERERVARERAERQRRRDEVYASFRREPQTVLSARRFRPSNGGDTVSYWSHNESGMAYEGGPRSRRTIWYWQPREGLLDAGVERGTVLFEGEKRGETLSGRARIFRRGCGAYTYPVEGPISRRGTRVTLRGTRPVVSRGCRVVGTAPDELIFDFEGERPPNARRDEPRLRDFPSASDEPRLRDFPPAPGSADRERRRERRAERRADRRIDGEPPFDGPGIGVWGPAYRTHNLPLGETLNVRSGPGTRFRVVGELPNRARDIVIVDEGCTPNPDTSRYERLSKLGKAEAIARSWCHISWDGLEGYVYGKYIRPQ